MTAGGGRKSNLTIGERDGLRRESQWSHIFPDLVVLSPLVSHSIPKPPPSMDLKHCLHPFSPILPYLVAKLSLNSIHIWLGKMSKVASVKGGRTGVDGVHTPCDEVQTPSFGDDFEAGCQVSMSGSPPLGHCPSASSPISSRTRTGISNSLFPHAFNTALQHDDAIQDGWGD